MGVGVLDGIKAILSPKLGIGLGLGLSLAIKNNVNSPPFVKSPIIDGEIYCPYNCGPTHHCPASGSPSNQPPRVYLGTKKVQESPLVHSLVSVFQKCVPSQQNGRKSKCPFKGPFAIQ